MEIKDFVALLVEIVLVPAIPIIATYLVKFFKAKTDEAITNADNAAVQQLLYEATDAVCTAVTYTAQTYVDSLKAKGDFGTEAQKEALSTALDKAKLLLTQEIKDLLATLYGDLDEWLTTKIEQTVKDQKVAA